MQAADPVKRIFVYGAGAISHFLPYVKSLTGKAEPRMCLLPTAIADNPSVINNWYERCNQLNIKGFTQRMFISSYEQQFSFEEVLLGMDAILVTGGNTLNMLSIWKAQGVDEILKTAWQRGIILSGGSAGSLCWFEHGTTDSRPQKVTSINCLGFLNGSHCPHYDSETSRRPLYHSHIQSGEFKPGYACDDRAAILFHDQDVHQVVALDQQSNAYYVYETNGEVVERKLEKTVISFGNS
jgi:dipeptidase E